jgi:hypothetical protein
MVDKNGDVSHYRKWWMSEKTPRTEMDEIEAAFAIINLSSTAYIFVFIYISLIFLYWV